MSMPRRNAFIVLAFWFVLPLGGTVAHGHDVNLTHVEAVFAADRTFRIDFHYDADAWLVGVRPEHLTRKDLEFYQAKSAEERLIREAEFQEFVRRRVKLRLDDALTDYDISFPTSERKSEPTPHDAVAPERIVRLTGIIPPAEKEFVLSCSKTFGNVILSARCGDNDVVIMRMDAGGRSEPIVLDFQSSVTKGENLSGALHVTWQFMVLGFEHILPMGLDHIAFVLGLFLLSSKLKPLVWQVTAFTVAHSITLALAVLGVVRLSEETIAGFVEPLIALSIVFVAVENVFTSKLHAWRPIVVFLFGLLHGLGFASMLLKIGIPEGHYVNALASFNVGVELGQLTVIGLAMLAVGWFRRAEWYRKFVVMPASLLIAVIGTKWAIERFMGA